MKKKSAIIPYRYNKGQLEILLIKNSSNTKWVIPKGTIEKPLKPAISATKEAYEEAGVLGVPHPVQIGTYHKNEQAVPTYLLEVSIELSHYEEDAKRDRSWNAVSDLEKYIEDDDLLKLLYLAEKVITKDKYYFKFAIKTFCDENNISLISITKKKASVSYLHQGGGTFVIDILRTKETLVFSIQNKNTFESIEQVPNTLQTIALLDNAENEMGYWCLSKVDEVYKFTRMYNEELMVLNCQLFFKILKSLVNNYLSFEEKMTSNK